MLDSDVNCDGRCARGCDAPEKLMLPSPMMLALTDIARNKRPKIFEQNILVNIEL